MLIKVGYTTETRADILAASDVYRAKVIDYTPEEIEQMSTQIRILRSHGADGFGSRLRG